MGVLTVNDWRYHYLETARGNLGVYAEEDVIGG